MKTMIFVAVMLIFAIPSLAYAVDVTDRNPTVEITVVDTQIEGREVDTTVVLNIIARDEGFRAGLRNIRVFEDNKEVNFKACQLSLKCEFRLTFIHNDKGSHTYKAVAEDYGHNTGSETKTIRFLGKEQPPEFIMSERFTVDEGFPLLFTLNALDKNDDPLTYTATKLPEGSSFDGRTLKWTPGFEQDGTHTVKFTVSDGKGGTDTISVSVIVRNKNRDPVITQFDPQSGMVVISEGATRTFSADATDADADDNLVYRWLVDGNVKSRKKTFEYKPDYDEAGTHQLVFEIDDGTAVVRQSRTIDVRDVNRNPTIKEIPNKDIEAGKSVSFSLGGKDLDKDNIYYTVEGLPSGAKFNTKTGSFSWRTVEGQDGIYDVKFKIFDGRGASATETVRIRVLKPDVSQAEIDQYVDYVKKLQEEEREREREERQGNSQNSGEDSPQPSQPTQPVASSPVCNAGYLCYAVTYFFR